MISPLRMHAFLSVFSFSVCGYKKALERKRRRKAGKYIKIWKKQENIWRFVQIARM